MNYGAWLQAAVFAGLMSTLAGVPILLADGSLTGGELWTLAVGFFAGFFGWMKTHPPVNDDGTPWNGVDRRKV